MTLNLPVDLVNLIISWISTCLMPSASAGGLLLIGEYSLAPMSQACYTYSAADCCNGLMVVHSFIWFVSVQHSDMGPVPGAAEEQDDYSKLARRQRAREGSD